MSSDRPSGDIYDRLIAAGTSEEEIEAVYRRLRRAGYGEEAARRRLEASLRRLREERARNERRGGPDRGRARDADAPAESSHTAPTARRRMEDWFPDVPPKLRRRINRWAVRENLLITGVRERWLDFLSHVRPSIPDLVNPRLLRLLAKRKHYLSENPYHYSLATTLDALYTVSRTFLGRSGGRREEERAVSDALRRRDPFVYEYLSRFAHFDDSLRRNLAYLELATEKRSDIPVAQLARITREVWRLAVTTEQVPRRKVAHALDLAKDVLLAYGKVDSYGVDLDDAAAIFQVGVENLRRFKLELYPVVLRAIGAFSEPEDTSGEKQERILVFLDTTESEILTVKGFYEQEARRHERQLAEQQMRELDSIEREKEAGFGRRFASVLSVLSSLFPDSGIESMERHVFLVPYFDERVFVFGLSFDHGVYSVEALSRYDPLQSIIVLHRIVDNLLSSIDHVRFEHLLGRKDVSEAIAEIKEEWTAVYPNLFLPYLRAINDYARGLSDEEYATRFVKTAAARRLEEEINQLRNRAIRGYGGTVIGPGAEATRLWSLVERLSLFLDELGGEMHQDIMRKKDPASAALYEELGRTPIVDFKEHAVPGTPSFKPVVRQLRRYIEAKHKSSISTVSRVAQLFLIDLLRGVTELYRFVTNDEASFVRSTGAKILTAGEEEREAWARERNRAGDMDDRLRIRLDEHLVSEYTDALTGLKTKNYFLQKLPATVQKLTQSNKPISLLMIDIDHFKWVNDELGHQKGDELLNDAATTILDGIRRGTDVGIRYGGEEVLVVTPSPLHAAVALGERLRFAQAEHVHQRDLYAPVRGIRQEKGEPCGTFSVGVAERRKGETLEGCLERADKALYESKRTRDAVSVSLAEPVGGRMLERYSEYAGRVKRSQAKDGG